MLQANLTIQKNWCAMAEFQTVVIHKKSWIEAIQTF